MTIISNFITRSNSLRRQKTRPLDYSKAAKSALDHCKEVILITPNNPNDKGKSNHFMENGNWQEKISNMNNCMEKINRLINTEFD
ncbi:MAG: hypothetical protein Tsb0015_02910 [Simkaniaceae bacterium]